MMMKSVLIIGNFGNYTPIITYALIQGYRVFCVKDFRGKFWILKHEDVKFVLIDNADGTIISIEERDLIDLIRSKALVVFTGKNGLKESIIGFFQTLKPTKSESPENKDDINNTIECFFEGRHCATQRRVNIIFKKESDFISMELNGNGEAQLKCQEQIKKAIAYMEDHYSENISLNHIAHAAYLSYYHFSRLFKKQMGITCCKYLSILRIERAKQLLKETEFSVTKVCFEVGFNNLTHFERVFKDMVGITPSFYKQYY